MKSCSSVAIKIMKKGKRERQNRSLIITFINATKEKKLERIQARIEG